MRIHHLNCGTIHIPGGVAMIGTGGVLTRARGVTHCVLVETGDGLLLVDSGWGTRDCAAPTPFMRVVIAMSGFGRDPQETAVRQVAQLGYTPSDVRHIALTHFHFDHAGGLADFPRAKVHIYQDEYEAVTQPRDMYERFPYRPEHWAHGPEWVVHALLGDRRFGLPCTPSVDLGTTTFCLVPLPGHTRGHCAVALHLPDTAGWLLHCGDAYTYHGEVDPEHPSHPPYHRLLRPLFNVNRAMRPIGAHAPLLRTLLREHGDELTLTCTHDPHEMIKFID
jgi:glyoxylase-like metal-dependent hydrolase (beta-lactamase superfamily II)